MHVCFRTKYVTMSLNKLRDSEGREAWHAAVHGVTRSWTQVSDKQQCHHGKEKDRKAKPEHIEVDK